MKTREYEAMFLLDNAAAVADWDGTSGIVDQLLTKYGAEIVHKEKWDERKLAYELGSARRGTYWLCYFEGPPDAPGKIRRTAGLSETVLRCLILAMDVAEEVPQDVTSKRSTVALGDDREPR
ncbi:MAG: 30S ribosomal protein S6 [Planctomycetaceae bacterium]|nr:30S ribosomal protein S6 [Planctomycetaceae bacterium]